MKTPIIGGDKDVEFLTQLDDVITIKGTLFYHESGQGWNTLRLKKEVLHEFPELRDKNRKGVYLMKVYRDVNRLMKEVEQLKGSNVKPVMLFFGKEKE